MKLRKLVIAVTRSSLLLSIVQRTKPRGQVQKWRRVAINVDVERRELARRSWRDGKVNDDTFGRPQLDAELYRFVQRKLLEALIS